MKLNQNPHLNSKLGNRWTEPWSAHLDLPCQEIVQLTHFFLYINTHTHPHTPTCPHTDTHTHTHAHTHAHTHTNGVRSSESASQILAWEELDKTLFGSGVFVARRCDGPLSPLLNFLSHDKLSQCCAIVACHSVANALNPAHNDKMSLVMKMSLMSHSYKALI